MKVKQRHGCVTAWLILMLIANSFVAISYLFFGNKVAQQFADPNSENLIFILGIIALLNTIFSILLFKWKKWAFWGYFLSGFIVFGINMNLGIGLFNSLMGMLGFIILFGVLQIKRDGVTAWQNMN